MCIFPVKCQLKAWEKLRVRYMIRLLDGQMGLLLVSPLADMCYATSPEPTHTLVQLIYDLC